MKILRIILSVFLCFSIVFSLFIGNGKIQEKVKYIESKEYKSIINLWHIDTFEGGKNSRKKFLEYVCKSFEKENSGVLINVVSMTAESANTSLKKGDCPDMISYGIGVNVEPVISININAEKSGMVGNKTYAVTWCYGKYFLISKNKDIDSLIFDNEISNVAISSSTYNLPVLSLLSNVEKIHDYKILSPLKAYLSLINDETDFLLGTQRDLYRLDSRGQSYKAICLNEFSDLCQYISLLTDDTQKQKLCFEFIKELTSQTVQKKLDGIGMFSYYTKVDFENEILNSSQDENIKNTLFAYTTQSEIKGLKELSLRALEKDKNAIEKLKKHISIS